MQHTKHDRLTQFGTLQERLATVLIHIGNYEWWLPWLYLVCMVIAELVTSLVQSRLGLLMYLLILLGLSIRDADLPSPATRRFMLGLTLALPLRVLSLALPHNMLQPRPWYPAVVLLFLTAGVIVIGQVGISRRTLGLEKAKLPLQLWLSSIGFGLGVIEYMILRPRFPLLNMTLGAMVLPALNLMLVAGVAEELILNEALRAGD
ncbi:MAG: hypothetical protein H0X37_16770 [Herpetosiphonaceae bacterium]|jgi:hypothetical protein|nr:hypothetical protein [Herpetosiphonaceae bacterium]